MKVYIRNVYSKGLNQGLPISKSELEGFAYMITRGAPKGLILKYIDENRILEFEQLGIINKDLSIIITDYFYITNKYIYEIIFLFFETFYRSMPIIKSTKNNLNQ